MKLFFILLTALLFCKCVFGNDTITEANRKGKIIDIVAKLPEVIKADNYCKKLSKGKKHLVTFIADFPSKESNYYLLKVAEDNRYALHAWFLFVVYPQSYRVDFYDPVKDKYIPLKTRQKHYKNHLKNLSCTEKFCCHC